MNDGTIFGGFVTAVTGGFVWFLKTVITEYHRRLDRHDVTMDWALTVLEKTAASQAQSAEAIRGMTLAINHNTEIAGNCEEVVSAQMRRRILAEQKAARQEVGDGLAAPK